MKYLLPIKKKENLLDKILIKEKTNSKSETKYKIPFQNEILRNNSSFINSYHEIRALELPYLAPETSQIKRIPLTQRKREVISKINKELFENPFDTIFNDFKIKQLEKKKLKKLNLKSLEFEQHHKHNNTGINEKCILKFINNYPTNLNHEYHFTQKQLKNKLKINDRIKLKIKNNKIFKFSRNNKINSQKYDTIE